MSILQEIVNGGVSKKTYSNDVIVFPRPRNESLTKIVYGDRVNTSIRGKISNWRSFTDVYWNKNGTLDGKFFNSLRATASEIFRLELSMNQDGILYLMKEIFNLPDKDFINGILMSHNLHEPISLGFRMNFMIWRDHLEELVLRFNEVRTKYIESHKLPDATNNIKALLKNWKHYNKYYKINSSSKLLLFSNLPETPQQIPSVKISVHKWNSRIKQFHWRVGKVKSTIILQEKLNKFLYMGYCPYKPIYRFNKLLEFPIKELLVATKELGGEVKVDYCGLLSKINNLKYIPKFSNTIPKLKKKKLPPVAVLKSEYNMASSVPHDIKNLSIRWYVDEYIKMCKLTKGYCASKEAYYIRLVKEITEIGHASSKYFYRRHDV